MATNNAIELLNQTANYLKKYGTRLTQEEVERIINAINAVARNIELKEQIASLKEQNKSE